MFDGDESMESRERMIIDMAIILFPGVCFVSFFNRFYLCNFNNLFFFFNEVKNCIRTRDMETIYYRRILKFQFFSIAPGKRI
ncbi:hypothetical protein Mhun_0302 [Methanospirillum hungatei JF-1]|uniref:Uncharacterized protein n=1 Tax=Methanospirillum hungatei JF-1 (strain ATCC 27890 / DSM 864 / NBRC 100397 / JF-1) TaxID=323259 RepID=Q2FQU7_METHJ|nr:hypothetical protein Mhun_0302 [Methanospirillum hungatei JF-1]